MAPTSPREQLLTELRTSGKASPAVLEALARTPRERFVPPELASRAYEDTALPIAAGQTISQPRMVAEMTTACCPSPRGRVLEVGTGSGYQAAILARLCREVVSVERIPELSKQAADRLRELGLNNVECVVGDGSLGWPARAPYDGILVTAGAPEIPWLLYDQLAPGGRLVIPVGVGTQTLLTISRTPAGPRTDTGVGCVFVPLIGEAGWPASAPAPANEPAPAAPPAT